VKSKRCLGFAPFISLPSFQSPVQGLQRILATGQPWEGRWASAKPQRLSLIELWRLVAMNSLSSAISPGARTYLFGTQPQKRLEKDWHSTTTMDRQTTLSCRQHRMPTPALFSANGTYPMRGSPVSAFALRCSCRRVAFCNGNSAGSRQFLTADVASYSRLSGVDEVGTLARLKHLRAEVIEPAVSQIEFASALDAVQRASEMQQRLQFNACLTKAFRPMLSVLFKCIQLYPTTSKYFRSQ
jgi:hypothetical protein